MESKNNYSSMSLEELIRGYAHAVEHSEWEDRKITRKMIVTEVYARIKNTFDMLDTVQEEAGHIYEMLIAPVGMERGNEDKEVQEKPDSLRGMKESSCGEEETVAAMLEGMQYLKQLSETELYRLAADELEDHGTHREAVSMAYAYEEKQMSDRPVHTAKEKIHARLKAHLKLSLLLLEDGYEDAAVDNIWGVIQSTRRGLQLGMSELLNGNSH